MRRLLLPLAVALAAALALGGCARAGDHPGTAAPAPAPTPTDRSAPRPATPLPRYVALGDSYTSAPYVSLTDLALGCLRSNHNYPHLLARSLHLALHDVSCSGAQTKDLTARQPTLRGGSVPAQLAALTRATTVVTLGIGGNDDGLFASLVGGCPITFPGVVLPRPTARCGAVDVPAATAAIRDIGNRVTRVLRTIHRRAPHAEVVLVGYPRIVSPTTTCPKLLPVRHADAVVVDQMTRLLADTMGSAARATHTAYVETYRASAGHDACSAHPWVNGVHTDTARAAALHPFAVEQAAVARLVATALHR